ncbi:unnamed protein product [Rhodiola kirilowii]
MQFHPFSLNPLPLPTFPGLLKRRDEKLRGEGLEFCPA